MLGITRPYLSNGKRAFYSIISYTCFSISLTAHDCLILIISILLRFMLTWFAFHWNAVWKCSFQWMPFIQSIRDFQSHWRFTITWKQSPDSSHDWINNLCVIRRGSFLSLSMLSIWEHEPYLLLWNSMIHVHHAHIYQTCVWNHWILNRIILWRF